jgi:hypothetical protein
MVIIIINKRCAHNILHLLTTAIKSASGEFQTNKDIYLYNDRQYHDSSILEIGGAQSTYGGKGNGYRVLVGKSEGKRPLGRPRCSWENTEIDLKETGWDSMDWINLAQDRDK